MDFVLISGPLLIAFGFALSVVVLGYQKVILTSVANTLAERSALADVSEADFANLADDELAHWNLRLANFSFSEHDGIAAVRLNLNGFAGWQIEAVGFATKELQ